MNEIEIKKAILEKYGSAARTGSSCCGGSTPACGDSRPETNSLGATGYSEEELRAIPDGANLGLGCGSPIGLAGLKAGETVLDLGSGAGIDCFLAAQRVGPTGTAIGVDMTPDMIGRARRNAEKAGYRNVEFRLGELEHLPVERESVDVVISNCVVNLVPDKKRVFAEMFRVLRPGGRFLISDVVLLRDLPDPVKSDMDLYVGCVAGASLQSVYLQLLVSAGFENVRVVEESAIPADVFPTGPGVEAGEGRTQILVGDSARGEGVAASIRVSGFKPA